MANTIFPKGLEGFLDGSIDADTAVLKASLMRGYTYDSTDKFVADVTATGTLVSTVTLGSKTVTGGTLDAADSTFSAVATGAACDMILIYQASAVTGGADVADTAQRLVALIDTATGLPVTPNSGDISVTWDADGIFTL